MAKEKKAAKKDFQKKIAEQLTITLSDLKERIGAKKFERRIQKASRYLSQGVKVAPAKKSEKKKTVDKMKDLGIDKTLATA